MISSVPVSSLLDSNGPRFGSLELEAPKALRSGYGASDRQKHNNTVKSMACPGARPQEIYTPENISDVILKVWPRVQMDPCWGPGSILPCEQYCYVPPRIEVRMVKNRKTGKHEEKSRIVFKAAPGEQSGLDIHWPDYTFANYPYAHADQWLPKAVAEAEYGTEIMLLGPVRPHRTWWRKAEMSTAETCYLNPVKFLGHKSALPLPLCMMYWGQNPSWFKACFEMAGLGECL